MKKFVNGVSLILALPISRANPQTVNYAPTIKIPVTFYDFHSDGSNPEFEKSTPVATYHALGWLPIRLMPKRKPILGPMPYWDCRIAKWFSAVDSRRFYHPQLYQSGHNYVQQSVHHGKL